MCNYALKARILEGMSKRHIEMWENTGFPADSINHSKKRQENGKMPFTYMLQCADGSFYTGWTTDLEARLKVHNEGKGARYTRSRLPVQLVYWETQPGRSEAQRREAFIRKLKRKQKEQLIKSFIAP